MLTTGSALTFDGANLGVGVAASSVIRTQIQGADQSTTKYALSVNDSVGNALYYIRNDGLSVWSTGATEQMRLTSTGLGIGTSSPATKLHVSGSSQVVGRFQSSQTEVDIQFITSGSTNNFFGVTNSTDYQWVLNSNTLMYLNSSGNLGIGTTSPGNTLTVGGTNPQIQISGSGTSTDFRINAAYGAAAVAALGTVGAHPMFFFTSNTERARIDSSGNLLIGTTSQQGKVAVNGVATSAPLVTFYSSTAGDVGQAGLLIGKQDNNTTTSQIILRASILSSGAGAGQINMNGANSLAFGTYSDQRLKENIVDIPPQLANIMALRPVEFDYIASEGGGHQTGFVAQEIQKVYSDSVGEREDGMLTVSGWSKTEARLVKAIQELKAEFDAYKAAHP